MYIVSRCRSCEEQRKQGISYVIAVAKQAELSLENYGDVSTLASETEFGWRFANTVLKAISEGNEMELLTRNLRCDSINATHWPQMISEYVLQPENSWAVPGQEMISV